MSIQVHGASRSFGYIQHSMGVQWVAHQRLQGDQLSRSSVQIPITLSSAESASSVGTDKSTRSQDAVNEVKNVVSTQAALFIVTGDVTGAPFALSFARNFLKLPLSLCEGSGTSIVSG